MKVNEEKNSIFDGVVIDTEEQRMDAMDLALTIFPEDHELTLDELDEILSTDVKFDKISKNIMFLLFLLTYTDSDQQNTDMTGAPSIGKTYTVKCLSWYFPKEDLEGYDGATPRSFHYDSKRKRLVLTNKDLEYPVFEEIDWTRKPQKGDNLQVWQDWTEYRRKFVYMRDLERKIVIFRDLPNYQLVKNLRPTLSHDEKYSRYCPVNKNMKTETIFIKGFFTCAICTTFSRQEPEERDRFWHLNPQWTEDKEKAVLDLIDRRNSDPDFMKSLELDPKRIWLKNRIHDIRSLNINEVYIPKEIVEKIRGWFDEHYQRKRPKKSRDYPRFYSLVKAWALLNHRNRKSEQRNGKKILWCDEKDFEVAVELYKDIASANEIGLSPEGYSLWTEIVKPLLNGEDGVTIRQIHQRYIEVTKRSMGDKRLKGFLHMFADCGLCIEDHQGRGKPTLYYAISNVPTNEEIEATFRQ